MKIAVIDKKDIIIKIDNNTIKIGEQTIPFKLVDILILNHRATLHTKDILKLTKENISILIISHNNEHSTIVNSANTKNGEIKLAQYNTLANRLQFAKYFIRNKIISHNEQLEAMGIKLDIQAKLTQVENATNIDEIMGIEGSFARTYFGYYFEKLPKNLHKNTRSKQPPKDPVNAMLSFWYSLFYNIITVKLLSYGFEPCLGYLHTPFRSHNALSSDILELFRAKINHAVYNIFKNNILDIDDFTKKGAGVYLKYEGRKKIWKDFVALETVLKPKLDEAIATIRGNLSKS